jgi:hypothetical protein
MQEDHSLLVIAAYKFIQLELTCNQEDHSLLVIAAY